MRKTVSFSKSATNVFFHLLTRCNLRCAHCYINRAQHGRRRIGLMEIETWLAALVRGTSKANVVFLGGEPTLHPQLPQAVNTARRLGYASVTIDTNGFLFNNILDKVTPEEIDFFSFSLDGATAATNDRLRGRGVYSRCLEGLRKAEAKGFATSLIYTVSSANLHELAKMPVLLKDLKVKRFFIQVIGLRGQSADQHGQQVAVADWLDLVPPVAEQAARLGITVTYPQVYLKEHEPFECAGLVADNYFVFPNRRVYRCPLCEDYPLHALQFGQDGTLRASPKVNEMDLFQLNIAEGCVMNKLVQPANLRYRADGRPEYRVACCLLKQELSG